ncbi:uncharacterized protein FIBRA_00939 [Fibroporia radiculosa]|uniref:Cyclin-like domain-containing protein n=1 Tax=Fibroporia radiculosa TaxID=599839 RepID=J4HSI0_9APHY|nr:uncharacterized protein FIBRA_00939 [Fibroporia radiculosa]CCL98932.1 predicted protein [Fibroporia radiculosa]
MALYTPPSLPHSPQYLSLPPPPPSPLPTELLVSWSSWRPPKPEPPLTPPLSNIPSTRVLPRHSHSKLVLPSIAHLDHALSRVLPVTPPQSSDPRDCYTSSLRLPAISHSHPQPPSQPHGLSATESLPSPSIHLDWFSTSEQRSSQFIAEKTCEMICYLWFSSLSESSSPSKRNRIASEDQIPYIPPSNSTTASLQFSVSPAFIRFMQKVLDTTQVSQSVIVLSLHYIFRMKARNRFTSGQAGSEYRVAIAALMMANKFLDDNTYTNKTWSEVSGIDLDEVNRMEKEFLLGIDFGLYVDKSTYDSWLNLLQGLVMAKERELQQWRRSWRPSRSLHRSHHPRQHPIHLVRSHSTSHRARSSSPKRCSSNTHTPSAYPMQIDSYAPPTHAAYLPPLVSGYKRSASDAFHASEMPSQPATEPPRRSMGLTLQIPELEHSSGCSSESSASPSEPLQSFAKLSLGASPVDNGGTQWTSAVGQYDVPRTLVSAYRIDDTRTYAVPENLYFYTLSCSPSQEDSDIRKGRLRYHQPIAHGSTAREIRPTVPMVVQSACASPYDMHVRLPVAAALPPFSKFSEHRPRAHMPACSQQHDALYSSRRAAYPSQTSVPSAPFANAGPPGFQFYSTAPPSSSPYSGSRGRRL